MRGLSAVACQQTPSGPGAVATILIEGSPEDLALLEGPFKGRLQRPLLEAAVGQVVYGYWGTAAPEEVVVCRISNRALEVHCHGGNAAVRRILNDLTLLGFHIRNPLSGAGDDSVRQECLRAVTAATTVRTAAILLSQVEKLPRAVEVILNASPGEAHALIEELLKWSAFGLHLTHPWSVVLCGRPNVGKSSLINALLGYSRAIVCEQPGTTRDVVTGHAAFDGWPVQLSDTAGIRTTDDSLERLGISRARQQLASADLRIIVIDISQPLQEEDRQLFRDWPDALVAANKSDLSDQWGRALPQRAVNVSALTSAGVGQLAHQITDILVPVVPGSSTAIPVTRRQIDLLSGARDKLVSGSGDDWRAPLRQLLAP